jgi:hypothetical protein
MVTIKDLEAFGDGWNRHDVDFLMTFMSDNCVFDDGRPRALRQALHRPRAGARGVRGRLQRFPDAHFGEARHFMAGDRGVSEWIFTGTTADGKSWRSTGATSSPSTGQDRREVLVLQEPHDVRE